MSVEINSNISISLHPDSVQALRGYSEETKTYLNQVESTLGAIYQSIDEVYKARSSASQNAAWTPAMQILKTADLADKYEKTAFAKMDALYKNFDDGVNHLEAEMNKPLEQTAGTGTVNGEIRAHFKSLGEGKSGSQLHNAIKEGDVKTATAILGAPSYLSGLSDTEHSHYLREYHETVNPVTAQRLAIKKEALTMMEKLPPLIVGAFSKAVGATHQEVQKLRERNNAANTALTVKQFG